MPKNSNIDKLRQKLSHGLPHPDEKVLREWAAQVSEWAIKHFHLLPRESIGTTASRRETEQALSEKAPSLGTDLPEVLREFEQKVLAKTYHPSHPRFLAFVPSAPSFIPILGEFLTSVTNLFGGVWLEAAAPSQVELIVLDWFKEILGLPAEARGSLTSGGSEANLTALIVAREQRPRADWDRLVLYAADQRHHSIDRAMMVIGLRKDQVRPIAVDAQYRMDPATLESEIASDRAVGRLPWAVVATAGTTNTGAVDPLRSIADICRKNSLWLHVDGAYGWAANLTEEGKTILDGINLCDSISLDPHKWLAQPFESGCLLVKNGSLLPKTFQIHADYLQDTESGAEEINFADHGLALTRRFRALKIWLSIRVHGLDWYRALVHRCLDLADYAEARLQESGCFEILTPRQLSIVTFRAIQADTDTEALNQFNLNLVKSLRDSGTGMISSTRLHGQVALRMCFINWRTNPKDVDLIVEHLRQHVHPVGRR